MIKRDDSSLEYLGFCRQKGHVYLKHKGDGHYAIQVEGRYGMDTIINFKGSDDNENGSN